MNGNGTYMIRNHWPLIVAAGILLVIAAVCYSNAIAKNDGHFVYVLDDPYIHMSIAKNFTQHGVWGITKHGFTSCSSSPLWTLTISAVYLIFGVNEPGPLILNMLIGIGLLVMLYILLRKYSVPPAWVFVTLLMTILAAPLVTLMFCGLEHTFHMLYSILFIYFVAKALTEDKNSPGDCVILALSALVLVSARYEGLFAIAVAGALFLLRGRILGALTVAGGGLVSPVLYGLVSMAKGWFFLPNSVILKGNTPDLTSVQGLITYFVDNGVFRIFTTPHILVLTLAAAGAVLILYRHQKTLWDERLLLTGQFIAVTILHMQFADTGWFYRYEGYLMGMGIFVLAVSMSDYLPGRRDRRTLPGGALGTAAAALLAIWGIFAFIPRAHSTMQVPQASNNIYEQQYHMGLFLKRYYEGASIAANDVGAINFLADIHCLDLWGLGSIDIARAMRNDEYTAQTLSRLATKENVEIAVMYETFFYMTGGRPRSWIKIHEWWLENNIVCGSNAVAFFAVQPGSKTKLIRSLRDFGPHGIRRRRR